MLSQVGALAAARFAERLAYLDLQPGDVGILRLIAVDPGLSQQALAGKLGVVPSRVVALIDVLQKKGLVMRERSVKDRRNHELQLTDSGKAVMAQMREIGAVKMLNDLPPDPAALFAQLDPAQFPHVTALARELTEHDPETDFEFGLDLMIRALDALPRHRG